MFVQNVATDFNHSDLNSHSGSNRTGQIGINVGTRYLFMLFYYYFEMRYLCANLHLYEKWLLLKYSQSNTKITIYKTEHLPFLKSAENI